MHLEAGQRLSNGRYQVLEHVHQNGPLHYWRVQDQQNRQQERIVQVPDSLFLQSQDRYQQLQLQKNIALQIQHKNFLRIHDIIIEQENGLEVPLFVMEPFHGVTLKHVLEHLQTNQGAMSWQQATQLALQVCETLEFAHQHRTANGNFRPLHHGDLRPENILLTQSGAIKLILFDQGASWEDLEENWPEESIRRMAYLPQEHWGNSKVTPSADLFGVGVLLFELLTGQLPFNTPNITTLQSFQRAKTAPAAFAFAKACPRPISALIQEATQPNALQRASSIKEFRQSLLKASKKAGLQNATQALVQLFLQVQSSQTAVSKKPVQPAKSPSLPPRSQIPVPPKNKPTATRALKSNFDLKSLGTPSNLAEPEHHFQDDEDPAEATMLQMDHLKPEAFGKKKDRTAQVPTFRLPEKQSLPRPAKSPLPFSATLLDSEDYEDEEDDPMDSTVMSTGGVNPFAAQIAKQNQMLMAAETTIQEEDEEEILDAADFLVEDSEEEEILDAADFLVDDDDPLNDTASSDDKGSFSGLTPKPAPAPPSMEMDFEDEDATVMGLSGNFDFLPNPNSSPKTMEFEDEDATVMGLSAHSGLTPKPGNPFAQSAVLADENDLPTRGDFLQQHTPSGNIAAIAPNNGFTQPSQAAVGSEHLQQRQFSNQMVPTASPAQAFQGFQQQRHTPPPASHYPNTPHLHTPGQPMAHAHQQAQVGFGQHPSGPAHTVPSPQAAPSFPDKASAKPKAEKKKNPWIFRIVLLVLILGAGTGAALFVPWDRLTGGGEAVAPPPSAFGGGQKNSQWLGGSQKQDGDDTYEIDPSSQQDDKSNPKKGTKRSTKKIRKRVRRTPRTRTPRRSPGADEPKPRVRSPKPRRRRRVPRVTGVTGLSVQLTPACTLYQGGQKLGASIPAKTIIRPAGSYTFKCINKKLFIKHSFTVKVQAGQMAKYNYKFPIGTLMVRSSPWASIHMKGYGRIGKTNKPLRMAAGSYRIVLYKKGNVLPGPGQKIMNVQVYGSRTTSPKKIDFPDFEED